MPRRKTSAGWMPKLTHLRRREMGRVRLPGQPDIYFGPKGIWPASKKKPPRAVEEAYRKVIADWLAAGGETSQKKSTIYSNGDSASIRELAAAYLDHVEKTYRKRGRPTALYDHTVSMAKPLLRLFADMPADQFGAKESRAVRDALLQDGTRSKGTVTRYGQRLKAMFAWAELEGVVSEDVMLRVRAVRWFGRGQMVRETPGRKKPVPQGDLNKTLFRLPKTALAMVRLLLVSGMRTQEVCFMRAGDVTEEEDGMWKYEAREDANKLSHQGIPKIVYLGPQSQAILEPFLEVARQKGPDAWVFPLSRPRGGCLGCIQPFYLEKLIARACRAANVPLWSPGRLRHTRGSQTRKKYGVEGAQAELGHLSPQMSARYTSSVMDDLARRIARETG